MNEPFKLGIAGTGHITAMAHLPAALATSAVKVSVLVDVVAERAQALADRFHIQPIISSRIKDALEHVDGMLIATPNSTHHDLAIECLEARIPVLIEKPLATTTPHAQAIARAAQASATTAAVGFCTRFYYNVQLMRQLLEAGFFGSPRHLEYQLGSVGGYSPESGYNLDPLNAGGGVLIVNGSHFLDRMLYWFGYPDDMGYADDSLGGPEASAIAHFNYQREDGLFECRARLSKAAEMPAGQVLRTEKGIVVMREGDYPIVFHPKDAAQAEVIIRPKSGTKASPADVYRLQLEDFVAACVEKRKPMASLQEGVASVRLVEELYARRTALKDV